MADPLTKPQLEVHKILFEVEDHQRTFVLNYKHALGTARRALVQEAAVATAVGLVLGGLVGALVGLSRSRGTAQKLE